MPRSSSRITKMWKASWQGPDGRERWREVWSVQEARTFLAKQADAVVCGVPIQLEDRWGIRWRDARHRYHKKVFKTQRAAKDHLLDQDGMRARGEASDPVGARRTLAEVFEVQTASKRYAVATLDLRRLVWTKHIEPELGDMRIGKIDTARIEALLAGIAGPEMRNKARTLLGVLFAYAMHPSRRWLTVSPVSRPQRDGTRAQRMERGSGSTNDRRRYLKEKELALLLSEIPARWRVMVETMGRMGLRPGEAYVLRVGKFTPATDVPESPPRLLIDTSLSGFTKTGEPRTLTLPAVLAEKLTAHIEEYSDPHDPDAPMFPKEDGTAIDSKTAAGTWRRWTFAPATIRAGLGDGFTVNSLRHSAASFAIDAGANIYDVQNMMGHAKPSITLDVYGERWEDSAERLAKRLDEAIRQGAVAPPQRGTVSEIGGGA